ncbi:hypothetical protein [uncultured Campylobacter sp.]|uniref:hypothetical protein n=1 Tax=uncultured Campylobacter sp. TaxID=218934 RepID=UPI0025D4C63D|nr:hypothetical protein [uncultured Campylobacter sp.]
MIDVKSIPIFIVVYNRLEGLKHLVSFLEKYEYLNIHIIDNNSSYLPLLEYYETLPYIIHKMNNNYGHMVLFKENEFRKIISNEYFVLTDSDILPIDECPENFLEIFMDILKKDNRITKVGFSLKIDDIPDYYQLKQNVLIWESRFYIKSRNYPECINYLAPIDTTFALYRPIKSFKKFNKKFYEAIRTGYPYQARHLPWYKNLEQPSQEDLYYSQTADKNINNWNGVLDVDELKKKYKKLPVYKYYILLFSIIPILKITNAIEQKFNLSLLGLEIFEKKIIEPGVISIKICKIPVFRRKINE